MNDDRPDYALSNRAIQRVVDDLQVSKSGI